MTFLSLRFELIFESWRVVIVFLEPKFIWGSKNKGLEFLCISWSALLFNLFKLLIVTVKLKNWGVTEVLHKGVEYQLRPK